MGGDESSGIAGIPEENPINVRLGPPVLVVFSP